MKRFLNNVIYLVLAVFILASCDEATPEVEIQSETAGCYILNFGSWGNAGASITKFDYLNDEITNNYYSSQNNGFELNSNFEFGNVVGDSIYVLANSADQLFTTNKLFMQNTNGVSEGLATPRYFVADGNYLYISCWNVLSFDDYSSGMPNSYIAKFNATTKTIENKIDLPGGPEGLEIINGKLYVALNYKENVAVIDIATESISYIATPAVTSYFVKDSNNNLYVSVVNTPSNPSEESGIGYINTTSNTWEDFHRLNGVSFEYAQIMSINNEKTSINILVVESYGAPGSAYVFDIETKEFSLFASDIDGAKGIVSNPDNGDVYIMTASSVVIGGLLKIYNEDGTFVEDKTVGQSPIWAFFLD